MCVSCALQETKNPGAQPERRELPASPRRQHWQEQRWQLLRGSFRDNARRFAQRYANETVAKAVNRAVNLFEAAARSRSHICR